MPFDPGLVERVRDALARLGERGMRERRVFGGYGFLQGKQTFVIVWGDGIIAKMTPDSYPGALARRGVAPFAPDGERPMATWVVVDADVIADDPELAEWVAMALQGVRVAPPPAVRRDAAPASGAKRSTGRAGGARGSKEAEPSSMDAPRKRKYAAGKPATRARVTKPSSSRGKRR